MHCPIIDYEICYRIVDYEICYKKFKHSNSPMVVADCSISLLLSLYVFGIGLGTYLSV